MIDDLRYTLRLLVKRPGFTVLIVLVLGLGIGANTAVFSVIDAVLLRPMPYPQSDRLTILREKETEFPFASVSYPDYLDWCAAQHSFTGISLSRRNSYNVSFPSAREVPPERIPGAEVTGNFLQVLGMRPSLGRDFTEAEDTPGGPNVAQISDALWRRRFGADPGVLGQSILADGILRQIVGVLPPEVTFPRAAEIVVPLGDTRKNPDTLNRQNHPGFTALGRLKPGVTLGHAMQEMDAIGAGLEIRYPDTNTGCRPALQAMLNYLVGKYNQSLYLLLGAVGCVLLIACANVANLQLALASGRRKELAVRAALGASRWRLMRQMLTESAVLGLLGGAVALLLALWAVDVITRLSPAGVPRFHEVRLDFAALGFTTAMALVTGLLSGAWPAWQLSGTAAMATALHEANARGGSGGAGQARTRALLVVAQLALTVVLLAGAGLTIKSFRRAQTMPLGFQQDNLLMVSIAPPDTKYPKEKFAPFLAALLERVRALPGVADASTASNAPFDDTEWDSDFHVTGTPPYKPGQEPHAEINYASTNYFRTMGISLLSGRDFDDRDRPGQGRSVLIDAPLAQAYFPGQDPIGKHLDDNQTRDKNAPPLTIIGIVGHTINEAPSSEQLWTRMPQIHFYAPQMDPTSVMLAVRVAGGDPMRLVEPIRRAVLEIDPELPIADVNTMRANVALSLAPQRLTVVLLSVFAALALVVASIGLYGVMALSVTQRTRELGIRLALGARRGGVLRLVLGQSARLVGIGLALGLVAALGAGKMLSSIVYGTSAADAEIFGLAALVLGGVGLLASYLPARRATLVDPLVALREE